MDQQKQKTYYDGYFLEMLHAGNKDAIKQACDIAWREFSGSDDEVVICIRAALRGIADGVEPNEAFGWTEPGKKGCKKESNGYRNWVIAQEVEELIKNGDSVTNAMTAVASVTKPELGVGFATIEKIRKRQAKFLPGLPDDIFPIPEGMRETMEELCKHISDQNYVP